MEGNTETLDNINLRTLRICFWTWLNLVMVAWFEPIFTTVSAASKNDACFKSVQKWLRKKNSAFLVKICDRLCRTKYFGLRTIKEIFHSRASKKEEKKTVDHWFTTKLITMVKFQLNLGHMPILPLDPILLNFHI